jgi:HEAT repeat protein
MNTMFRFLTVVALASPATLWSQDMAINVNVGATAAHAPIVIPSSLVNENEAQADTALRVAKEALNDGDYVEAARLFARVAARYPKTPQAAEALYWRSWSLYRAGGTNNLSAAMTSLNDLQRLYPSSTVNRNDAGSLRVRICGELAQRGNEECAREVVTTASTNTSTNTSTSTRSSQGGSQARSCPAEDDENDERIMALGALMNMNAEAAVPILERVLAKRDDCSKGLRRKAVFLLSQKRSPEVVDILLKTAREDPDPGVREQAVFWLSNVRDPRVVDMLAEMAMNSSDPAIQEKAIFSLSNTRSEKASQILRDIAQRENASKGSREQAIFWLGNRRDTAATAFLRGLYPKLTDRDLKEKVLFSVANQRATGSGEWLVGIAMNEREPMELRKQALFHAGNNRAASVAEIATLYDRTTDKEMKEQVIFVLSQNSRDTASIDKLMDIARRDTDREMRSKAIFWLGQSRDPRVIKFLEEIINK